MKKTLFYVCSNCGYRSVKWLGRCPSCNLWETFVKEEERDVPSERWISWAEEEFTNLKDIDLNTDHRFTCGLDELDRVLGGGFVEGETILLGGEPGIGKSTLCLQVAINIAQEKKVFYVSAEESVQQVGMRSRRLGLRAPDNLYILGAGNIKSIIEILDKESPDFVIIDSVQVMYDPGLDSSPGSVVQTKQCAFTLSKFCKQKRIPLVLIGHITKEGLIAGPKILEHMVDAVLYFEGERLSHYRILRAQKNRFGPTNEIAVFEMTSQGLREVSNPSQHFISQDKDNSSGMSVGCILEGTRPLLVEVQSLVCKSSFSMVRRRAEGFDYNRFLLLLAVLEKRAGLNLFNQDVFLNIAGGLKVQDTSLDLAVAVSIFSSFKEIIVEPRACFIGELSLSGGIRGVYLLEKRVLEAKRLGFKKFFLPLSSKKELQSLSGSEFIFCSHIKEAFSHLKRGG